MDSKANLVSRICSISTTSSSCTHRVRDDRKPAFVDWYLILEVEENAVAEEIRKRYRELVLKLHPDKNSHAKAEVAFKLVSEAYACLSDKDRRRAFNLERTKIQYCSQCSNSPAPETMNQFKSDNSKEKKTTQQERARRVLQALREAKKMVEEEAKVIDKCLMRRVHQESPLFDPVDYLAIPGYPHRRRIQAPPRSPGSVSGRFVRKDWCESPIFEVGSCGGQTRGSRS